MQSCSTCQHSIGTYNGGLNCRKYGFELIRYATRSVSENQQNDAAIALRAGACENYVRDVGIEAPCSMCGSRLGTSAEDSFDGNPRCLNCGCY